MRILAIIALPLVFTAACAPKETDVRAFYERHRDGKDLEKFKGVSIHFARGGLEATLWEYGGVIMRMVDESHIDNLPEQYYRWTELVEHIQAEHDISEDELNRYLTDLFRSFIDLKIRGIFWIGESYLSLHLDDRVWMVFIPDQATLTDRVRKDISRYRERMIEEFDEHWFSYTAEPDN